MTANRFRDPETRELARKAEAAGWTVTMTRKSHVRFESPAGEVVIHSGSTKFRRAHANHRARLRRAGLDC